MIFESPSNSFEWMIFLAQKYSSMFAKGTWLTLYIAVAGTLLGFVLGYIVGIVNDIKLNEGDTVIKKFLIRIMKVIFTVYVEVFRDTPMIVQAMIVYFGIRQMGFENLTPVFAGIVVTVLNTGAYMGETVRAGIGSIDLGQREGAWAMGMSPFKTMLYVVLPQAFRNIIPEMAKYVSDKPKDDIGIKCYCSTGTVYGSENCRWKLLQILRIIPCYRRHLLCSLLCI